MPSSVQRSPEEIRAQFPALRSGTIFLENAGGSQVPGVVADAIRDFLTGSYVQLGAGYEDSVRAGHTVEAARRFLRTYFHAEVGDRVWFAPSASQACKAIAEAYADIMRPGDEVVVAQTGHEANVGPWFKLAPGGIAVKLWPVDPRSMQCELDVLEELVGDRTRIVAYPITSNLLGDIADFQKIADIAHRAGAKVVADAVAYAPHRALDVQFIDADWVVYSMYKVFGPHLAGVWARQDAVSAVSGPGHFFFAPDDTGKWELGCPNFEGIAGFLALSNYLAYVSGSDSPTDGAVDRSTIERAWESLTALELPLQDRLIEYLDSKPGVRRIGPVSSGPDRVAIVSFVSDRATPPEITAVTDRAGIGIRHGHAYAVRLCEGLGLDPATGVVRVSFSHYNTQQEVDRLIEVLDSVL